MSDIQLDDKVARLRRPEVYPDSPRTVGAIQTHWSWVFLTESSAYKIKKPIRDASLDLRTTEQRQRNCHEEVRLNRRLAADVYLGVVALTRASEGTLALGGRGEPVDWLVHMRRLPADRMLDAILISGRAASEEHEIRATARHLATFFLHGHRPEPISGSEFRHRLRQGVQADLHALVEPRFRLARDRVEALALAQLAFLEQRHEIFDQRVLTDRIVDGHGDLRPEHVCVQPEPAVIDCLEFDRQLRRLDPADEMAFLGLECERLNQPWVGRWFLDIYREVTGDTPPESLLHFYRVYRALRRAKIAVSHLDDPSVPDPASFAERARRYLELVEPVDLDLRRGGDSDGATRPPRARPTIRPRANGESPRR